MTFKLPTKDKYYMTTLLLRNKDVALHLNQLEFHSSFRMAVPSLVKMCPIVPIVLENDIFSVTNGKFCGLSNKQT